MATPPSPPPPPAAWPEDITERERDQKARLEQDLGVEVRAEDAEDVFRMLERSA